MRLSCKLYRFRVIAHFSSKVANFNLSHLHLSPPLGVIPFEFRRELWCQKTRVQGLSCGIICAILRLAILIQFRSVTDRHATTAYTALSIASRGKNAFADGNVAHVHRIKMRSGRVGSAAVEFTTYRPFTAIVKHSIGPLAVVSPPHQAVQ